MECKKAQISMEFMIIIGAVLFFVTIFFSAVQHSTEEKMYQRETIMVKEIALTIQNEINLASSSMDGYVRKFDIPNKAGNLDYTANLTEGIIYIKTTNNKHAIVLPTATVIGNINIPNNTIKKIAGEIFINQ